MKSPVSQSKHELVHVNLTFMGTLVVLAAIMTVLVAVLVLVAVAMIVAMIIMAFVMTVVMPMPMLMCMAMAMAMTMALSAMRNLALLFFLLLVRQLLTLRMHQNKLKDVCTWVLTLIHCKD
jgi:hypothetical protein